MEWIGRTPSIPLTRPAREIDIPISRVLADAAWAVQAVALGFLTWFVLGDSMSTLGQVVVSGITGAGAVALWQVLLSVVALVIPFGFAALLGYVVRRDDGSHALALAAMVGAVLLVGLTESGLVALLLLFFS